jgi:AcrR family transcriptional regulator
MGQRQDISTADIILDKALELAETGSWEDLHLHDISAALEIPLGNIREYYLQKDDIAEAWFDRADRRLLCWQPEEVFYELPEYTRLRQVIMYWFDALEPHHRISREMLCYKLEPGHIHLQALGVMRISRTVQWFREVARLQACSVSRIIEETVVTGIYLASFGRWLYDDSPHRNSNTESFLARALECLKHQDNSRNHIHTTNP